MGNLRRFQRRLGVNKPPGRRALVRERAGLIEHVVGLARECETLEAERDALLDDRVEDWTFGEGPAIMEEPPPLVGAFARATGGSRE